MVERDMGAEDEPSPPAVEARRIPLVGLRNLLARQSEGWGKFGAALADTDEALAVCLNLVRAPESHADIDAIRTHEAVKHFQEDGWRFTTAIPGDYCSYAIALMWRSAPAVKET